MDSLAARFSLRLAVCVGVTFVAWLGMGLIALPICAPLFGVLLARPILDFMSTTHRVAKTLALADVEGQYYVHRGTPLSIAEDENHVRWVSVRDIRKVLEGFPRDAVLARQYAQDFREGSVGTLLRAEALLHYLGRASEPAALKFKIWLEREVVRPAAKKRDRLGIREVDRDWAPTQRVATEDALPERPSNAAADPAPHPAPDAARQAKT